MPKHKKIPKILSPKKTDNISKKQARDAVKKVMSKKLKKVIVTIDVTKYTDSSLFGVICDTDNEALQKVAYTLKDASRIVESCLRSNIDQSTVSLLDEVRNPIGKIEFKR